MINLKNAKILFIDDDVDAVNNFIEYLKEEGYSNVSLLKSVSSLAQVLNQKADLIYLDIAGVASVIDPKDEGLSILRHVKAKNPWSRVVVFSGSSFSADKAPDVAKADVCISKASLSLVEFLELTELQLKESLSPEFRNIKILKMIEEQLDTIDLGYLKKRKLKNTITESLRQGRDSNFDWNKSVNVIKGILSSVPDFLSIIDGLVEK